MLEKEQLQKIIGKMRGLGGEFSDIFIEQRKQTSIVMEDSKIEKIMSGVTTGAGLRRIRNSKTAYAFSNDLSETALLQCVSGLGNTTEGDDQQDHVELQGRKPQVDFLVQLPPDDVRMDRKISLVRTADKTARNLDKRIKQVSVIYRDSVQKVQIATSDNVMAEDERVYTTAIVQVIARQDAIIQTGYESVGGLIGFELFDMYDIEELSLRAAERALRMLSARKAPGGRMPVIITSHAGGTMIHEAIGHGLEADLAQQGLSVFSDKKGTRVASEAVTVIDDATLAQKRGSFRVDDEGTPSQRTVLVEKGILKGYLYDRLTAMKDGAASTGNGRRESYQHRPLPRMTNTFIAPGDSSPDEIIRSLDRGLLVEKMGGGQVNTVNGDFVFDIQEGFLIENGCKAEPVRGATLTGNGPRILQSIDMVGNDLGFSIGTCGKDGQGVPVSDAMPTIRLPEIVVGGAVDR